MRHGVIEDSLAVQVSRSEQLQAKSKICQTRVKCNQDRVTRSHCTLHVGWTKQVGGNTLSLQPSGVA